MKYSIFIFLLLSNVFWACAHEKTAETTAETPTAPIVGNDQDKHGCKASAGETWSALQQECVRLFEAGIRLHPVDKSLDANLSAFAIIGKNEEQAEVFMPNIKESKVLTKAKDGSWRMNDLRLSEEGGQYVLSLAKQVFFRSDK